jgi:secernin
MRLPDANAMFPTSCDTLVALGSRTAGGATLFAKNSDRPPAECQPLFHAPCQTHPLGAVVRCQYVTVPQARETLAVLGSRPWWLWGFEHGVNECRVAIGNEALHAREMPGQAGLLGMDLVRLGLERGRTAREAKRVITDLVERVGQGGSASVDTDRRYHNGFLIADPGEAWVVETFGPHWVARHVVGAAAVSNLFSIETNWDDASVGAERVLRKRGWAIEPDGQPVNFRRAVEKADMRYRAEARLDASCRFLDTAAPVTIPRLMRPLRDHYDSDAVHCPGRREDDPRGWSICMHPGPSLSATAAGMVVELSADPARPLVAWCALTTPCSSVFLPIPIGVPLPEPLTHGDGKPDPTGAWWRLKQLGDEVQRDPARRTPVVQAVWDPWEAALLDEQRQDPAGARTQLAARVQDLLVRTDGLRAHLG